MNFLYVFAKKSIFDLPWAFIEEGYSINIFENYSFDPLETDDDAYLALQTYLEQNPTDCVLSYLFFPKISDICMKYNIHYISWTYDSPLVSLFSPALNNPCNDTFIFDKAEYDYLLQRGSKNIHYLPMAANISRTGALEITTEDEKNYTCDISFIGNLYEENAYNSYISLFPDSLSLELKTWLMQNLCKWDTQKEWPRTSPAVTDFLITQLHADQWNQFELDNNLYFGMLILTRKLAEMDRITVLNTLSQDHTVDLYTNSHSPHLTDIKIHTGVDYYTEMNKIFYLSKINLNITLPSIETGLPQRIFDIMGCGGFVLTNYQPELDDLFTIGEDIEVFHNLEELQAKVNYYLTHEKERLTIAVNGYKKVRDHHTYVHRIKQIMETINL